MREAKLAMASGELTGYAGVRHEKPFEIRCFVNVCF